MDTFGFDLAAQNMPALHHFVAKVLTRLAARSMETGVMLATEPAREQYLMVTGDVLAAEPAPAQYSLKLLYAVVIQCVFSFGQRAIGTHHDAGSSSPSMCSYEICQAKHMETMCSCPLVHHTILDTSSQCRYVGETLEHWPTTPQVTNEVRPPGVPKIN